MTTYALSERVAWLEAEVSPGAAVFAATLPDGPPVALAGTGGLIFLAITPGGSLEEILARVAEAAEISVDEIREDVTGFVEELIGLGLVTPT